MKQNSRQKGFSLIEVLIVLFILAVLGLVAWYAWHKNKSNSVTPTNGQTSQTQSVQKSTPDPHPSDPSQVGKYLLIKEWNLRVTLPEGLREDISYFVNDVAEKSSGGAVRIDFVSKKFSEGKLKCAVIENAPRTLIGIYYEEVTDGRPDPSNFSPPPFKTIGNRLYFMTGSGCQEAIEREGSPDDRQLLTNLKEAIINSLESY